MILALAILIVGLLLPDVTRSCPCDNPQPFDLSSSLSCTNINSVINGIRGKSVAQCQPVTVTTTGPPPGVQTCSLPSAYNPQNDQSLLQSQGDGYRFYRIFQPGYHLEECYDGNVFCAYNVQCSPDEILYYHFSAHDIENPTSTGQCLDSININRQSFPNQPLSSCGRVGINGAGFSTYDVVQDGYDIGSLDATFRSNSRCSGTGYFLWVDCVRNDTSNYAGMCPKVTTSGFAYKRTIRVPLRSTLIYSNRKLILTGCFGKKLLAKNIFLLKVVYDGSHQVFTFRSSYKARKFQGEGLLNVHYYCRIRGYKKYCVAKYKFIGVPFRLRLTRSEQLNVTRLLRAIVYRFNGKGDYSIPNMNQTEVVRPSKRGLNDDIAPSDIDTKGYYRYSRPRSIDINLKALAFELSRSSKAIARSVGRFYLQVVHRG
ncbi:PREDICTED: uncharacterized protein LOC109583358 [Amphimedon queenslandica]|uniref:CUB domain-containing protein n=2 Tax=Amphimedon queenslandica TaxID=400682 RepID=A0AAN0JBV3_AMPQE|nr:PREDICTED: uncharacterized protein LOC109583358 [Amphimedon queenslandica]|eukprot:XP_019854226.1 PREDICTED: uncharacterized protein LOC109583358 [Amphimedon queenslandica]